MVGAHPVGQFGQLALALCHLGLEALHHRVVDDLWQAGAVACAGAGIERRRLRGHHLPGQIGHAAGFHVESFLGFDQAFFALIGGELLLSLIEFFAQLDDLLVKPGSRQLGGRHAQVEAGLRTSGRTREQYTVSYPGLIATGTDEKSFEAACRGVRGQISFYGSTPAYRGVLDMHGWGDLHEELHALSLRGEWQTMATLIDDDVLNTFAVVGEPEQIGPEILRRFDGLVDRFSIYAPYDLDDAVRSRIVADLHA